MDISIIIPSYNTKNATFEAVKACLVEGSNLKKEIIVIDNNSSDGSYSYLSDEFKDEKSVILIKNSKNFGFAKAVNMGLKKSKGEYKLLLNCDTKVTKFSFKKLIDYAKSDENIGVIGTKLILPDGSIQKSCFNFPSVTNAVLEYWFGVKNKFSSFYKDGIFEVDAVVGAAFFITPKAYKSVGLMDERYFMYYEDLDYCRRVKNANMKVIYYPKVIIYHSHGLSGKKVADEKNQWRRLIPSSVIFNGYLKHNLINFILWSGQKWGSIINKGK